MKEKNSMVFYYDWLEYLNMLPTAEVFKDVFNAVVAFSKSGKTSSFKEPTAQMAYKMITNQVARDSKKYTEKCEKCSQSGKLGGRPKKRTVSQKANGFLGKQRKAKKADTDTEPVPDTENDTVPETAPDSENESHPPPRKEKEVGLREGSEENRVIPPSVPQGGDAQQPDGHCAGGGVFSEGFKEFLKLFPDETSGSSKLIAWDQWKSLSPNKEQEREICGQAAALLEKRSDLLPPYILGQCERKLHEKR